MHAQSYRTSVLDKTFNQNENKTTRMNLPGKKKECIKLTFMFKLLTAKHVMPMLLKLYYG